MIDRGIIKWQPFNSFFTSNDIIRELEKEKNKKEYPILSEDQLNNIEKNLKDAFNLQIKIQLEYYWNGNIFKLNGKIKQIYYQEKKILFESKIIYFKQILKINY